MGKIDPGLGKQEAGLSQRQGRQRERLFHATMSVALESGFGRVTMDAVAGRAGISKGGLLYHFPSKTHLIQALLARYAAEPCRDTSQSIPAGSGACDGIDPRAVAVLIAAAEKPSLLDPFADRESDPVAGEESSAGRRWRTLMGCLPKRSC